MEVVVVPSPRLQMTVAVGLVVRTKPLASVSKRTMPK